MAELDTHRPISVTVAKERLQIKTDLGEAELKEILHFVDERFESYSKYNLEVGKRWALLALDLGQQLFEFRKQIRQVRAERDHLENSIKEISILLDEGLEHPVEQ